jgi:hypothetical protein
MAKASDSVTPWRLPEKMIVNGEDKYRPNRAISITRF